MKVAQSKKALWNKALSEAGDYQTIKHKEPDVSKKPSLNTSRRPGLFTANDTESDIEPEEENFNAYQYFNEDNLQNIVTFVDKDHDNFRLVKTYKGQPKLY